MAVTREQLSQLRQGQAQYFDPLLFLDLRLDSKDAPCRQGEQDVVGEIPTVRYTCDWLAGAQIGPRLERWRRRLDYDENLSLELWLDAGERSTSTCCASRPSSWSSSSPCDRTAIAAAVLAPSPNRVGRALSADVV